MGARTPNKLTPLQRLVVAELYDERKASAAELAAVYGVSQQTIYYTLGPVARRRRWADPEQVKAMVRRGLPWQDIAQHLEIGKSTVFYWKKKLKDEEHVKTEETDRNGADCSQATVTDHHAPAD